MKETKKETCHEKKSSLPKAEQRHQPDEKLMKNDATQPLTKADSLRLIHELQARQTELEMKNEELTRARAEVEAAYGQYTDLYDFAPVGYFTLTRDGTILQVNLEGANLAGVERAQLINRRLELFLADESRPVFGGFLQKLLSCEGKATCEVTFPKTGNELRWARIEATCFDGGQECRAVLMDISERVKAEMALRESEDRYRGLIELAVDGILIGSHDGVIIGANSYMLNLTGRTLENLIGLHIRELFNPDELNSNTLRFDLLQKGETVISARNLIRADGKVIPIEMHTKMMPDGTYQSIYRDVTERKKTEDALRQSEAHYHLLADNMTDVIWLMDLNFKYLYISPSVDKTREYQLRNLPLEQALTPASFKRAMEAYAVEMPKIMSDPAYSPTITLEFEYYWTDGLLYTCETKISIIRDENGNPTTMLGLDRDITGRKRAEAALRESQEMFSLFMIHSPIFAFIKEVTPTESRVLQASDNFQEMIGISGRDMMGKTMQDLFPPESAAKFTADDWAVLSKGVVLKLDEDLNGRNYTTIKFPIMLGDKTLLAGYTIDITERKQAQVELEYMKAGLEMANRELQTALAREKELARTDVGTGVDNRRHLFERAEHEIEVAARYRQPLSVMMFDIDHFKDVNDTFGHAVGDQILRSIAQIARAELRSVDVIGRYGGEEFIVLLPMTNAKQAHPLAERIRAGVAGLRLPTPKGNASATLSIGIVEMNHAAPAESVEDIFRRVDIAMYAAKQAGRNCIVIS